MSHRNRLDGLAMNSRVFITTASPVSVRDLGTLVGLVLIFAAFAFIAPSFFNAQNLINILQQSAINACVAIGMTIVIISGGIDLSVGPVAALSAVVAATLMVKGLPPSVGFVAGVLVGIVCGSINGVIVAYCGLQPFIVTLGTLSIYRAAALIFTGGNPVLGIPDAFRNALSATFLGFPMSVLIVAIVAVLAWVMLRKMPLGEYIFAVGGNEEAARVAGVPVERSKIFAYSISGGLASLGAMIVVARLGAAEPVLGNLWELDAIAAAAIGGASLLGGKGGVIGTLLGAIILGGMRNGLTLMNVQAFYQLLATGIVILLAMMVDRLTRGRR
jgi:ribose transport system permease protein